MDVEDTAGAGAGAGAGVGAAEEALEKSNRSFKADDEDAAGLAGAADEEKAPKLPRPLPDR